MAKGMVLRRLLLMLSIAISGCGYSADHALDNHQQEKVTESKLNVVKGSVYGGKDRPIALSFNNQDIQVLDQYQRSNFELQADYAFALHKPGFLDDDDKFYFQNAVTDAILSATFDGYTLYSFYQGTPIPKTDVTITQDYNWHDSDKLTLHVSKNSPSATISINPFSNLAYWLRTVDSSTYASFDAARDRVNKALGLPDSCRFEEELCTSHLTLLKNGVEIHADANSFTIIRPGNTSCSGSLTQFTDCPL